MSRSQKTPSAGIMRFWKTKTKPAAKLTAPAIVSEQEQLSSFVPGYLRLEQRTLLSATFTTFGTNELVLSDFDAGQNLDFAQQDAVVNGVLQDSFIFTVDSGSFTGNSFNPSLELESVNGGLNNQLEVATAFFQGSAANAQLTIDGSTSTGAFVEFTQTSPALTFDSLEIRNFANDNRDFNLQATGDVTLDNVTVFDSNPTDTVTTPATLDVAILGNLNLDGLTGNLSADPNADVNLSASGSISMAAGAELTSAQEVSIFSTNQSITLADVSAGGEVQVQAANNVVQRIDSQLVAGSSVNFVATSGSATVADISAGDDLQVQAMNNIVQRAGTEIASGSDIALASTNGSITLDDVTAAGEIQATAFDNIEQRANSQVVAGTNVDIAAANGAVTLADVSTVDALQISASNNITQQASSDIVVGTSATVSSTAGNILLAATPDQNIDIQGQASFTATQIEIGLDGQNTGSPAATNVQLGSVSLNASQAVLIEDDATLLSGNSNVNELFVSSALDLGNTTDASLNATNAQLNSLTDIVLGNQAGDSILLGEVSLIANNAHLEVDGDLIVNGVQPTAGNSQPIALGTNIDQTLFVVADGSVEQTQGNLSAQQIGIAATEHVHLTSVEGVNEAIAISAGGSQLLTDPSLSSTLNALTAVENGEVDATRPQAISVDHRGEAVVTSVTSVTGIDSLTGFNSTDGSISVFADQSISLEQDITAFGAAADPQITLFSAAGDATDPTIFFDGGQATVTGPTNFGVVNANQVFANFIDDDGFLFDGTTQLLTFNTDGTVSQDIEIEFGNLGEAGFRVGIVFDSQNTALNPVEDLNLFTPSNTVASEAFEDALFQNNTVTRVLIDGNGGGRETFSKVEDFTAEAAIATFDDPNVFSDITVRNDQDINLFSGSLASVDNSLNENRQELLQAVFDLPRRGELPLPAISVINSIEVRRTFDLPFDAPTPLDQTSSVFEREVAPFESGELRWVQVEIPIDDMEMVGDEVILKQPSLLYPAIDDAAEQIFENVGENETDRIVNQIERSPAAEPGYWFRIFKAYDNRDDELIFYYYKTGEVEVDSTPADTLNDPDISPVDETLDNGSFDNEISEPDSPTQEPQPEPNANDSSNYSTGNHPSQSVAASTILIGLLQREAKRTGSTNDQANDQDLPITSAPSRRDVAVGDEQSDQTASTESFDRLSRLKRKLKRCL